MRNTLSVGEGVLLFVMAGASVYMYVGASEFSPIVAAMPRISAIITGTGVFLFLSWVFLPEDIKTKFQTEDQEDGLLDDVELDSRGETTDEIRDDASKLRVYLSLLFSGYVLLGYLIGFLWVTPITVIIYSIWMDLSWTETIVVLLVTTISAYIFMEYLFIPVDTGVFTGGRPIS